MPETSSRSLTLPHCPALCPAYPFLSSSPFRYIRLYINHLMSYRIRVRARSSVTTAFPQHLACYPGSQALERHSKDSRNVVSPFPPSFGCWHPPPTSYLTNPRSQPHEPPTHLRARTPPFHHVVRSRAEASCVLSRANRAQRAGFDLPCGHRCATCATCRWRLRRDRACRAGSRRRASWPAPSQTSCTRAGSLTA